MPTKDNIPTHKQLRHWVADRLRTAVLEGGLRPGEWLRQERLAEEYGVSQMPVREALKELAAEGLVEHVPYHGVRVVEFSPDDVADLYACRALLESMAARAAARNITPEELAELKDLQARMKQRMAPEHLAEYRELNRHFHQVVYVSSRRAYLVRTLNQMWAAFPSMLWSNFTQTAMTSLSARATDGAEHDAIIAALASHRAKEAERVVRYHIEEAGGQLVAALKRANESNTPSH